MAKRAASVIPILFMAAACGPSNNLTEEEAWEVAHYTQGSATQGANQSSNIISGFLGFGVAEQECPYGGTAKFGISFDDAFSGSGALFSYDIAVDDCSYDDEVWQTGSYSFTIAPFNVGDTCAGFEYHLAGAVISTGKIEGDYDFDYKLSLESCYDPNAGSYSFAAEYSGTVSGHELEDLSKKYSWSFTTDDLPKQ